MCAARVPLDPGHRKSLCQNRLTQRRARQCRGIEAGERVKRIALHIGSSDCRVEKTQIKRGVVTNKNGASAVVGMYGVADFSEYPSECVLLRQCWPQWMKRIYPRNGQCGWIESGTFERSHMKTVRRAALQLPIGLHVDEYCGDLEQGISRGMKPAGFNINDNR